MANDAGPKVVPEMMDMCSSMAFNRSVVMLPAWLSSSPAGPARVHHQIRRLELEDRLIEVQMLSQLLRI